MAIRASLRRRRGGKTKRHPASTFRVLEVRRSARDSGRSGGGGLQAQATRMLTAHSHVGTSSHRHTLSHDGSGTRQG